MSDKLQFFKFSPSDWMMGRIQKCPLEAQALYIKVLCIYWNKDCVFTKEDAEIELEEHYKTLIKYKIIEEDGNFINIKFLDEQRFEIDKKSNKKSENGKLGNLKRWHNELWKKVNSGQISESEAFEIAEQSQSIAHRSQSNRTPIAEQSHTDRNESQSIADKDKDKDKEEENALLDKPKELYDSENGFEEFYNKFGNKKKKEEALKAWKRLSKSDRVLAIEKIPNFLDYKAKTGEAIPYPSSYLNGKRWNDDFTINQTKLNGNTQNQYREVVYGSVKSPF